MYMIVCVCVFDIKNQQAVWTFNSRYYLCQLFTGWICLWRREFHTPRSAIFSRNNEQQINSIRCRETLRTSDARDVRKSCTEKQECFEFSYRKIRKREIYFFHVVCAMCKIVFPILIRLCFFPEWKMKNKRSETRSLANIRNIFELVALRGAHGFTFFSLSVAAARFGC